MSFFNLRRGGQSSKSKAGSNAQAESVDIVRKRAKHRLIGAAVLVLIGVVGFPLLFDSQPRPVPVDIAIDIPNKNSVRQLITPQPVPATTPVAEAPPAATAAAVVSNTPPKEESVSAKPAAAAAVVAAAPAPVSKKGPEAKAEAVVPKVDDSARARALLEGNAAPAVAASDVRLVVQVGAYADAAKAREARLKLEKAGLKTYAQVVDTKDGQRTRVRVGPFPSRAEAEQVASKIKSLGLPVTILTL
ncbi:MAG: SPOR domain-containing protein [Polaromonas sp.]|nr:SPOR domain-containing protein [Polaromonas sp.]